jgi:hypothetical protein
MNTTSIELDFGPVVIDATLFNTPIARKLIKILPVTVPLMQWGNEFYGSIGVDLGEEHPVEEIPPGGIAYTNSGNYVCIFFGQRPAWAVEHIGQIVDDRWQCLGEIPDCRSVTIRATAGESLGSHSK